MDEFSLIEKYFTSVGNSPGVVLGIGDDAAVLKPSDGHELVFAADTLVEGRHYDAHITPTDLGYKSLAVNISDIAAMGAQPRWFSLSIGLSTVDELWLTAFSEGLKQAAQQYRCALVGGDTVRSSEGIIGISVIGEVEAGKALRRSGAQAGDVIAVGGPIGIAQQTWRDRENASERAKNLFYRPQAQLQLGQALIGYASSCIDISDGLISEMGHLGRASGVSMIIDMECMRNLHKLNLSEEEFALIFSGGEDYSLLFTIKPSQWSRFQRRNAELAAQCAQIGSCAEGGGLWLQQNGERKELKPSGYNHFLPGLAG